MTHISSSSELLAVEFDGPIRILRLNNPSKMNAITDELHEALSNIWDQLSRDLSARVIILTGEGEAFSAGGNISSFEKGVNDQSYRRSHIRTARVLMEKVLACHLPVIAAVNGPAVGLGSSLVVAADLVIMAEGSYLSDAHVDVGLVAADGAVATLPFLTSMVVAKEYLFTGERIPAEVAVSLGLANRVVPRGALMMEAKTIAELLASKPPQALQETKRALNLHMQQASLEALPAALAAESESFTTPEVARFLRKVGNKHS